MNLTAGKVAAIGAGVAGVIILAIVLSHEPTKAQNYEPPSPDATFAPPTIYPAVDDAAVPLPDAAPAPDARPETRAERRERIAAEKAEARALAEEERAAAREAKRVEREEAAAARQESRVSEAEKKRWMARELAKLAERQQAPATFRYAAAELGVRIDFSTRGPYETTLTLHSAGCGSEMLGLFLSPETVRVLSAIDFMFVECVGGADNAMVKLPAD